MRPQPVPSRGAQRLRSGPCLPSPRHWTVPPAGVRGEPLVTDGAHGAGQRICQPVQIRASIHSAMPIIIRFSVSETKPSGTLLLPPTQAHFSSLRSI